MAGLLCAEAAEDDDKMAKTVAISGRCSCFCTMEV